jgi:hypothetical protein
LIYVRFNRLIGPEVRYDAPADIAEQQ